MSSRSRPQIPALRLLATAAAVIAALVAMATTPAFAQAPNAPASIATVSLRAGFLPDPWERSLPAGGNLRVNFSGCTGYILSAPTVRLNWTASQLNRMQLWIYVIASGDTMLVVRSPNGQWHCNDDYADRRARLNPAILFNNPASGSYAIWVGTYGSRQVAGARLHISEIQPRWAW